MLSQDETPGIGGIIIKIAIVISVLLLLSGFTCTAFADQPVPAVPETQGIVTSTAADVVGMATETDAGAWTLTNDPLVIYTYNVVSGFESWGTLYFDQVRQQLEAAGGSIVGIPMGGDMVDIQQINVPQSLLNTDMPSFYETYLEYLSTDPTMSGPVITGKGIHTGILDPGQVQYTTAYDASILAQAGHTVLAKQVDINTGNKVAATQSNLNAHTLLTYIATDDGGNVVGSENLLIDGAGNFTPASDRILCPFAGGNTTIIPAYCNIVQAGSSYDLTVGSVTTTASDRFVGTDATVPVILNYNINVKPYDTSSGNIPAMGSASAYIKVHIQEARGQTAYNITYVPDGDPPYSYMVYEPLAKAEDIQYSETTTANGVISMFSKSMGYSSQATSTPLRVIPLTFVEAED